MITKLDNKNNKFTVYKTEDFKKEDSFYEL